MSYYNRKTRDAVLALTDLLARPMPDQDEIGCEGFFDPWGLFPSLYGSYDQVFDHCAIEVLIEIRDGEKNRHDLGAEMLREMLCTAGLCDYGTSPRVCFPAYGVEPLLAPLIEKWSAFSALSWSRA